MTDTVIREVTDNVWTFSRPFYRFNVFPVGGRSTVIKLSNGDLWVAASTPLDADTKSKLEGLGGKVKYIIGLDAVHNLYLPELKAAYPDAKLIGVPAHLSKPNLKGLKFDGVYGVDPEGTKYGFEDEIKSRYFSGFVNQDVAFNHIESRTLIEADLLFNLPAKEQFSKSKSYGGFPALGNLFGPYSWAHKKFVYNAGVNKEAMRRDARAVAEWDFDRIIPCHGDTIETNGKNAWLEAYKWFLQ
ncbi:hypothetical protein PNOK_0328600 [Pyrrhoderma noxium]|uniref:Uncharacterized protein n=1 Tax=Pyrrhoderma noxium TaxID=2282107 RepID=A0A286UM90_9AGAM|nr:hypothetical protein PNOK_0328600 [Pyrrhoderma noxium]